MARILLVDDSTYQRVKLRKLLISAGYEVVEAVDGDEGLAAAAGGGFDCILLDLLMPRISGTDVLREMNAKQVRIPVVIHTSDIQDETRQECLALGAVAFLNKPVKEENLLAAIALAVQAGEAKK